MSDLSSLLSSSVGGGLFGVIGQVANRVFAVWETREKRKDAMIANAHEMKRWDNEKQLLEIQMKQAEEAHEQELQTTAVVGSWGGLTESLKADANTRASYKWVEAVRALVRPILTLESQIAVVIIFFAATGAERATIQSQVVETITFISTAAALWWFGERAERKGKH